MREGCRRLAGPEKKEGETLERSLRGQTGGIVQESSSVDNSSFFSFMRFFFFFKAGLSILLFLMALNFLIICCLYIAA